MALSEDLVLKLQQLAQKYEVPSFTAEDPSQFLRWYKSAADIEAASFIAAMLAFGNRKQFIPKITSILQLADKTSGSISAWLLSGAPDFPKGSQKFYRFYSYDDMHSLFSEMSAILKSHGSLGEYFKQKYIEEGKAFPCLQPAQQSSATPSSGHCNSKNSPQRSVLLHELVEGAFPESAIVPKGKNSANKRIHMYLRWMVRQNSCVDLGLWNWYPQSKLFIPLDVHVMQEGVKLGLLAQNASASYKTAVQLTKAMEQVFPEDPARADFALFGLGVDKKN